MRHPHERYGRLAPEDGRRGRGPGGGRGRMHESEVPSAEGVDGFFAGRLPDAWGTPEVRVDRDEITVLVTIEAPAAEGSEADVAAAEQGRISRWREETRDERVQIAREAEHRYGRKVAWGATARSRAEALAWCEKLVGEHADSWLAELRQAMEAVQKVREQGPGL